MESSNPAASNGTHERYHISLMTAWHLTMLYGMLACNARVHGTRCVWAWSPLASIYHLLAVSVAALNSQPVVVHSSAAEGLTSMQLLSLLVVTARSCRCRGSCVHCRCLCLKCERPIAGRRSCDRTCVSVAVLCQVMCHVWSSWLCLLP